MKIDYITGCQYNNLKINDKDAEKIPINELKTICKKLIDECNDSDSLRQIIIDYLYDIGPVDSYVCEQCGDLVEIFKVNIVTPDELYYGDDNGRAE